MERVDPGDLPPDGFGEGVDRRVLSDALGTTDVAINRYRIAPGEGFPSGLHAHADQEEVFVVLAGEATFETLPATDPDAGGGDGDGRHEARRRGREVVVRAGEAIRFGPGEFQSGRNAGDDDLVALAIGAPRDSEDVRIPFACGACGAPDLRLDTDDALTFVCPDCGAESVPTPCPECGGGVRGALADGRAAVVCEDCGAVFERPPVEGTE